MDERAKLLMRKLEGTASCVGCQALYFHDSGYSNYTVEETQVYCALDKNPGLKDGARQPWDWNYETENDNWPVTKDGVCGSYRQIGANIDHVHRDVDCHDVVRSDYEGSIDSDILDHIFGS